MKAPGLIRPAALMILGLAAIAFALWSLASSADRWQAVCALTFSPDSQTLAAGTFNGKHFNENFHWCIGDLVQTVALFDSETGSRRVVIDESHHPGTSWGLPSTPLGQFLCFSPEGDMLAVGSWDGAVRLWEPRTRELKNTLQAESPRVAAVAFSSDGRTLVARYRFSLTFWNTANYEEHKELETYADSSVLAIPPAKNLLVAGESNGRRTRNMGCGS